MLLRDSLYTTAFFGLISMVWFGWAQASPLEVWRVPMIVASALGALVAIGFGVLTARHWQEPTALVDSYARFGIIVAAEFGLGGAGAAIFGLTGNARWMAWWLAVVIAVHFVSLAWLFHGPSLAVLGAVQVLGLVVIAILTRGDTYPTVRYVGPVMGSTILAYALVSGVVVVRRLRG